MLRALVSRLRDWIAVDDPDDRIEGSGETITSPQHRRSAEAEQTLEQLEDHSQENRRDDP